MSACAERLGPTRDQRGRRREKGEDKAYLAECALAYTPQEDEMEKVDISVKVDRLLERE